MESTVSGEILFFPSESQAVSLFVFPFFFFSTFSLSLSLSVSCTQTYTHTYIHMHHTATTLEDISLSRLTDPVFLLMLLSLRRPAESHRVEMLYDVLLPWLARGPLSSALDPILVRAARVSSPCPGNAT